VDGHRALKKKDHRSVQGKKKSNFSEGSGRDEAEEGKKREHLMSARLGEGGFHLGKGGVIER